MASASLAKFSELLRHQLYECNDHEIPLGKEITYLENFIELEKLRQNENIQVTFELEKTGTEPLGIAPFILMTFLENAFKHVSKHQHEPNWIDIKLSLEGQKLDFRIANSTSTEGNREAVNYGGIGLKNVRRRLDLIYPGKYELGINDEPGRFEVHFTIMLEIVVLTQAAQIA